MRQSNIELLRLISIILIVVVHADFFSLSAPNYELLISSPVATITQLSIESIAICAVNVFIFISGWFGIRPKIKSMCNLGFQILYFTIGIYITCLIMGVSSLNFGGLLEIFYFSSPGWFIRAYICLLIIAPILNLYVENANQKQFKIILVSFFLFQTLYGWLFDVAEFFKLGYSTISFVGIYLLARYIKIYAPKLSKFKAKTDITIFFTLVVILTALAFIPTYLSNSSRMWQVYAYNNPIVITMALYLFLFFSKLNINNNTINWFAASSFAIYLLHANPNLTTKYFIAPIKHIFITYNGIECFLLIGGIVLTYIIGGIILDIPRKVIWNKYIAPRFK